MSRKKIPSPRQLLFNFTGSNPKGICANAPLGNVVSLCSWRKMSMKPDADKEREVVSRIVNYSNALDW